MSVVGFDVGNESCVVAVARKIGINAVLNDELKRETPAVVCYGKKQRFLGTASMMNPIYTMSQIKRFIGRKFSDTVLQKDIKSLPFSVTEGPDGYPLIHAQYLGKNRTFTPTQLLGMVLSDLKIIAEKNLNAAVFDCCIAIPVYFTDLQRRAVIDAATIAGLNPLHLIHEATATALAYGIYKTDLPVNEPINVAFVDIGHASMQVCIAAFKKGQLKILAHSYDQCLGGRDFDEVLIQHFAAKFKDEYKVDFYQNASACLRLRAACEKLKKVLSVNAEASLNIQCFMDEKDVIGFIKRDDFEQISNPILERMRMPLEKALACARLTTQDIHSVEVVGLGSRVPMITKILTKFFGKEPGRTMDASKCVAEGSALQCAILSPTLKVQDFQVIESFPFLIVLVWKLPPPDDTPTGEADRWQSTVFFPPGNPMPCLKELTFYRSGTFTIDVLHIDGSKPSNISTYTIEPFLSTKGEKVKLKVKVHLNLHGVVSIESTMLVEEEEVEVPVVKEERDDTRPGSTETDVNIQDANADGHGAENGVPESGDKTSHMEMDKSIEARLEGLAKAMEDQAARTSARLEGLAMAMEDQAARTSAMLERLAMAMEDRAARTSAIEAKFDNLAASQKFQFDLIMQQITALGSRIGLKESTSRTAAEESTILRHQQTMDLPTFDGSDALAWLASVDQYFLVHKTPAEKQVELALAALSGPAMSWIQLLLRCNPDLTWDQFTHELLVRFGSDPALDGHEALPTPSQEGSLDDYVAEFEECLAQLPELAEKQYLGLFLGGLKPHIRMQIRDPTITTYTDALQMAKHIDFVFKRMWDEEFNRRRPADPSPA
ncbi:heat shock 70 kDa protein 15-like [Salvia splendens]|uniref:heat shock 70 kDa protein 15-like n=1 Tax=Salvia splendens TaxID=180675 RepID=UPI001100D5AA|nr:heat shock 70 kDa protein 15-like [Salvia splendens]XP_042057011.1 heat shock 70 kDa protein 15-like [Salvia splendens]